MGTPTAREAVEEIVHWEHYSAELRHPETWAELLGRSYLQPWLEVKLVGDLRIVLQHPEFDGRDEETENRLLAALSAWETVGNNLRDTVATYAARSPGLFIRLQTHMGRLRGSTIRCDLYRAKDWFDDPGLHVRVEELLREYGCQMGDVPYYWNLQEAAKSTVHVWFRASPAPVAFLLHRMPEIQRPRFRRGLGSILLEYYLSLADEGTDAFGWLLVWIESGVCEVEAVYSLFLGSGFPGEPKPKVIAPPPDPAHRRVSHWLPKLRPGPVRTILTDCARCDSFALLVEILEVWLGEKYPGASVMWDAHLRLREITVNDLLGEERMAAPEVREWLRPLCRLLPVARLRPPPLAAAWFAAVYDRDSSKLSRLPQDICGLLERYIASG